MKRLKHGLVFWATLSITIPNAVVNRSTAAFCGSYGYAASINGSPNPETPIQFTQRMVASFIKQVVVGFESKQAAETARQTQTTTTSSDVAGIQ